MREGCLQRHGPAHCSPPRHTVPQQLLTRGCRRPARRPQTRWSSTARRTPEAREARSTTGRGLWEGGPAVCCCARRQKRVQGSQAQPTLLACLSSRLPQPDAMLRQQAGTAGAERTCLPSLMSSAEPPMKFQKRQMMRPCATGGVKKCVGQAWCLAGSTQPLCVPHGAAPNCSCSFKHSHIPGPEAHQVGPVGAAHGDLGLGGDLACGRGAREGSMSSGLAAPHRTFRRRCSAQKELSASAPQQPYGVVRDHDDSTAAHP